MDTVTEVVDIRAPAESAFAYVDDIRNAGGGACARWSGTPSERLKCARS
jgi:hypothetical protein